MKLLALCCLALLACCAVATSPPATPAPEPDIPVPDEMKAHMDKITANEACEECLDELDDPEDEEAMLGDKCKDVVMTHTTAGCGEVCAGAEEAIGAIVAYACDVFIPLGAAAAVADAVAAPTTAAP